MVMSAVVLTAGMPLAVMMIVVITSCIRVIVKAACNEILYCVVCISIHTAIEPNA